MIYGDVGTKIEMWYQPRRIHGRLLNLYQYLLANASKIARAIFLGGLSNSPTTTVPAYSLVAVQIYAVLTMTSMIMILSDIRTCAKCVLNAQSLYVLIAG